MNITLAGYFGFNNLGDEAILQNAIAQIKKHNDKHNILVLSNNPDYTSATYNVLSVNRSKIPNVIAAIRHCDLLIFPGGSIFQDYTSIKSLVYYLLHILIARIFNKKIVLYGQGFSHFKHYISKLLFRNIALYAHHISVRDKSSLEFLKNINFKKTNIKVVADLVLCMIPLKIQNKYKKTIGLNLRPVHHTNFQLPIYDLTAALSLLHQQEHVKFLYFAFSPEDLKYGNELQKFLGNDILEIVTIGKYPSEVLSYIDQCELFIGMRLHSLILLMDICL